MELFHFVNKAINLPSLKLSNKEKKKAFVSHCKLFHSIKKVTKIASQKLQS